LSHWRRSTANVTVLLQEVVVAVVVVVVEYQVVAEAVGVGAESVRPFLGHIPIAEEAVATIAED
jgi:hypothetical protein